MHPPARSLQNRGACMCGRSFKYQSLKRKQLNLQFECICSCHHGNWTRWRFLRMQQVASAGARLHLRKLLIFFKFYDSRNTHATSAGFDGAFVRQIQSVEVKNRLRKPKESANMAPSSLWTAMKRKNSMLEVIGSTQSRYFGTKCLWTSEIALLRVSRTPTPT